MLPARRILLVVVAVLALTFFPVAIGAEDLLPTRLSDEAFWKLVSDFSEPGGSFTSDNFVSNERSFQHVVPNLVRDQRSASAYIGVGPEQNFTYILALRPRIAFIVDIRRQNLVEHLMYKALFELSADRGEFLSRLYSRARPKSVSSDPSIDALLRAFGRVPADAQILQDNLRAIKQRLTVTHGFKLTTEDEAGLDKILQAFARGGNNLTYNGPVVGPGGILPTFEEMMRLTDKEGVQRSFLATEEGFLAIKEFEGKNLVIPVVGDFAGPSALRSIGQYLRDHGATVTAFYTSNVEQYLFLNGVASGFYANVATLPVSPKSVLIRGLLRSGNGEFSASPAFTFESTFESGLFSIPDLVEHFSAGAVRNYNNIFLGVSSR